MPGLNEAAQFQFNLSPNLICNIYLERVSSPHTYCFWYFEAQTCYVAQPGPEFVIFLPQPLVCWDCRHAPPHQAPSFTFLQRLVPQ
jgi:hypothetical protein